MVSLANLQVDEPGTELLVPLCGHAMTRDTFDGLLQWNKFFRREEQQDGKAQLVPVPIAELEELARRDDDSLRRPPVCTQCRVPITGLRRYARCINWFAIKTVQRKWLVSISTRGPALAARAAALEERLLARSSVEQAVGKFDKELHRDVNSLQRDAKALLKDATKDAPTQRLFEAESAARQRLDGAAAGAAAQLVQPVAGPQMVALETSLRAWFVSALARARNPTAAQRETRQVLMIARMFL